MEKYGAIMHNYETSTQEVIPTIDPGEPKQKGRPQSPLPMPSHPNITPRYIKFVLGVFAGVIIAKILPIIIAS